MHPGGHVGKELPPDQGLLDAVRNMKSSVLTLTGSKSRIARATSLAVEHAERGGARMMTEVIASRLEEVLFLPSLCSATLSNY